MTNKRIQTFGNALVLDQQQLFAHSFGFLLKHMCGFRNISSCGNFNEALSQLQQHPDIRYLFADYKLLNANALDAIQKMRGTNQDLKMIIIGSVSHEYIVSRLVKCGVNGILSKDGREEDVIDCIAFVERGKIYLNETIRNNIVSKAISNNAGGIYLTPREWDVLYGLCNGRSLTELQQDLGLSLHTIRSYHREIKRKMNVSKTTDMILYAVRQGLFTF